MNKVALVGDLEEIRLLAETMAAVESIQTTDIDVTSKESFLREASDILNQNMKSFKK